MFRNVGSKCFCHDSKNSHTSRFFFKHNQQDGEEYSDRLLVSFRPKRGISPGRHFKKERDSSLPSERQKVSSYLTASFANRYGRFSTLRASPVSCRMCIPVLARSTM